MKPPKTFQIRLCLSGSSIQLFTFENSAKVKLAKRRKRKKLKMEARNTVLQQKRLEVEQLRREAAMKRIPVSQALEDIKTYIRDHGQEDCLVVGFQGKNSNPYREKSSCQVL